MKKIKPQPFNIEEEKLLYAEAIHKSLTELARRAWIMGIDINEVTIKDNQAWVGREGVLAYADKYIIPAPDMIEIITDYMTIKVNVKRL